MNQSYGGTGYTGEPYPTPGKNGPPYPQPAGGVPNQTGYPPPGMNGPPYPQPAGGVPNQTGYPPHQSGGPQGEGGFPPFGDEGQQEPEPSAPLPDSMEQLPGYRNIGFDGALLPPPSYDDVMREPEPQRETIKSTATINEQDAREAILQHVSEHCCYGKAPAVQMQFTNMNSTAAFHYTLETFAESRSTKWDNQPFRNEIYSVNGPPPGPWDISAVAPELFKDSTLNVEVPNTSSVKPCYKCNALGFRRCGFCFGRGRTRCMSCNGSGHRSEFRDGRHHHTACGFCQHGWKRCFTCHGSGRVICGTCQGTAALRWFILLTIKWINHLEDHIVERTALPDHLIRKVRGQTAFEETNPRVWPINHFPEQEINSASNNLVSKHGSQFNSERILMQRHRVRVVPVTEVSYSYKNKTSSFFVYGEEHKVYSPDYPAKCCCGCSIL